MLPASVTSDGPSPCVVATTAVARKNVTRSCVSPRRDRAHRTPAAIARATGRTDTDTPSSANDRSSRQRPQAQSAHARPAVRRLYNEMAGPGATPPPLFSGRGRIGSFRGPGSPADRRRQARHASPGDHLRIEDAEDRPGQRRSPAGRAPRIGQTASAPARRSWDLRSEIRDRGFAIEVAIAIRGQDAALSRRRGPAAPGRRSRIPNRESRSPAAPSARQIGHGGLLAVHRDHHARAAR